MIVIYSLHTDCHVMLMLMQSNRYLRHTSICKPLQGKRVLELGSGCGFVGIAVACMGANVAVTDLPCTMVKHLCPVYLMPCPPSLSCFCRSLMVEAKACSTLSIQ